MYKIILNIKNLDEVSLASVAARYLINHPEKEDVVLQYNDRVTFFVKRNKSSISVWEQ